MLLATLSKKKKFDSPLHLLPRECVRWHLIVSELEEILEEILTWTSELEEILVLSECSPFNFHIVVQI